MDYILKEGEYTYDASEQTITLISKWNELTLSQIKKIHNITRNSTIYDVAAMRYSISISSGIITYTKDTSVYDDSDKLQIIIDTELTDLTDADRILFETDTVNPGEIIASDGFNIMGYEDIMLFVKTAKNFEVYIQFTDNLGSNPDWFEQCTVLGVAISFTCNNSSKAISVPCKAAKVRVLMKNNDTVGDIPYCGVI